MKNFNHVILKWLSIKIGIIPLPVTKAEILSRLNQYNPVVGLPVRIVLKKSLIKVVSTVDSIFRFLMMMRASLFNSKDRI